MTACPKCGSRFDEAVPPDAEEPQRGWKSRVETNRSSQPTPEAISSTPSSPSGAEGHDEPYPDYILPDNTDKAYWQGKTQQVKRMIGTLASSASRQKFVKTPLALGLVFLAIVLVLIAVIRPHTNAAVFEQHPLYQSNVALLCHPPPSSLLGQMGAEVVWPYQGREDRLQCTLHSIGSAGTVSDAPAPMSKEDLNFEVILVRAEFCKIRYRSGFTPDEAMQCQVYVNFPNVSDTGYDGPDISPARDAAAKSLLSQSQE